MPIRKARAEWKGNLQEGNGSVKTESGIVNHPYSFKSRFENGNGTNPEELLGAAHAACYSMALALGLSAAGFKVHSINTEDKVHIEKVEEGFKITKIEIDTKAKIDGIDERKFLIFAEETKNGCPVSKALTGTEFVLNAKLI